MARNDFDVFSWRVISVISFFLCSALGLSFTEPIKIATGVKIIGINGTTYQSFMGIPFAEPPLKHLRFANPQAKPLWSGTLTANATPPACIQLNFLLPQQSVMGAEDCLYLNIYRPQRRIFTKHTKLPVMVYLHGGAFFSGSIDPGIHGPGYFMNTGEVILVLAQYRLSTLGFLSTGDDESPGNFGLKDQSMALRWVKEHISAFGGNPDAITIFGQSAGAASVHMHMLSPLSEGLFNQAIAMSGSALGPYNCPTPNPIELTRKHAKIVGIEGADTLSTAELVQRLRDIPAEILISSVAELKFFDVDLLTVYRTVVENSTGAFLTDSPLNLIRQGKFAKVPFMTGLVEVEGAVRAAAIITNETVRGELNERMNELIPKLMELQLTGNELTNFTQKILNRYLPDSHKITAENEESFIKLYTDRSFVYPHYKQLEFMMAVSNIPIYTYLFNYRGEHSYSGLFTGTASDFGVVHCDDLIYLFESPFIFPGGLNEKDQEMSRNLVQHYVRFAKNRSPWERTRLNNNRYQLGPYWLISGSGESAKYYYDWELVRFWDQSKEL